MAFCHQQLSNYFSCPLRFLLSKFSISSEIKTMKCKKCSSARCFSDNVYSFKQFFCISKLFLVILPVSLQNIRKSLDLM